MKCQFLSIVLLCSCNKYKVIRLLGLNGRYECVFYIMNDIEIRLRKISAQSKNRLSFLDFLITINKYILIRINSFKVNVWNKMKSFLMKMMKQFVLHLCAREQPAALQTRTHFLCSIKQRKGESMAMPVEVSVAVTAAVVVTQWLQQSHWF